MSGFDDAEKLALDNGWRLEWSQATLAPGPGVGSPTELRVLVRLVPIDGRDVGAQGEGSTHVEAVRRALGLAEPHSITDGQLG